MNDDDNYGPCTTCKLPPERCRLEEATNWHGSELMPHDVRGCDKWEPREEAKR